ncbi:uncharacterized protein B0H18DRAFT_412000 [Fomitopsis serialis]|uniref:uncharacterized protein n=1 Tax=Fomitopsis serialis TaxID=139415 RepID=UPI0020072BEF|nr:uncharacterized protein B0H18DRAFT_412000 [Neoantrodia serialis]KAH9935379.1 hypothetical protein B0H18DRAFT_412000 [Neoantrodia serialis]
MRFPDLDDHSLSSILSFLDQRDSLTLSLTSCRIHSLAKRHALSEIDIRTAAQLERICSYLLADVTNRLHFVRALTVSKVAFGIRYYEAGDFSAAHILADVLERASPLKMLRLDATGALFEAEPRVASAICRLDQLVHVDLRGLTSPSFEVVDRLSCAPRRLSLHGYVATLSKDRGDWTSLLSASIMRRVRSLRLVRLRIGNPRDHSGDDNPCHTPTQWPEVRDLQIEHTFVSVATLVHTFPLARTIHFQTRKDIKDWEQRNPADLPPWSLTTETACWPYLDRVDGSNPDFERWRIACKVRWLILDSGSGSMISRTVTFVQQTLSILQRTWPVAFSLHGSPGMLDATFWGDLVRSAPHIRYLDLTLASGGKEEDKIPWTVSQPT